MRPSSASASANQQQQQQQQHAGRRRRGRAAAVGPLRAAAAGDTAGGAARDPARDAAGDTTGDADSGNRGTSKEGSGDSEGSGGIGRGNGGQAASLEKETLRGGGQKKEDNLAPSSSSSSAPPSLVMAAAAAPRAGPLGAWGRIKARPWEHLQIPLVAAAVGWVTNKIAVEMLFYPLKFWGWEAWRLPGTPWGLLGWQGIVPTKATVMATRIVDMVTTELIDVNALFKRLDPKEVARLLSPEVDSMASSIAREALPKSLRGLLARGSGIGVGIPDDAEVFLRAAAIKARLLEGLVRDLQRAPRDVLDLTALAVGELARDPRVLVDLFKRVGRKELDFLVNSGFGIGFLLGLVQMAVWALYPKRWTLFLAGGIVGCATNGIALKCIFEPVAPTTVLPWCFGGFTIQGLFMQRQAEVSGEFAAYMTDHVFTAPRLWSALLEGPKAERFRSLLDVRLRRALTAAAGMLQVDPLSVPMEGICEGVWRRLPAHVGVLHGYTERALDLKALMAAKMQAMRPQDFEAVLHPIFQEDEMVLILAGGVLGVLAVWLQLWFQDRSDRREKRRLASQRDYDGVDGI